MCSRRSRTSRRSPRRTSSACTSSSRSPRRSDEGARFATATDAVFERTLEANRQRALYVPLLTFLPLVAQAARPARRRAAWWSRDRSRSVTFFTFNLLLAMLVMPLRMLGMWIGQAQRATAPGSGSSRCSTSPRRSLTGRAHGRCRPGPGLVQLRGRRLRLRALSGPYSKRLDLEIAAGRTLALIGRTGSGQDDAGSARSTLLRRHGRASARRRHRRARRRATVRCVARSA